MAPSSKLPVPFITHTFFHGLNIEYTVKYWGFIPASTCVSADQLQHFGYVPNGSICDDEDLARIWALHGLLVYPGQCPQEVGAPHVSSHPLDIFVCLHESDLCAFRNRKSGDAIRATVTVGEASIRKQHLSNCVVSPVQTSPTVCCQDKFTVWYQTPQLLWVRVAKREQTQAH